MNEPDLDDLLGRSLPVIEHSILVDQAALGVARDTMRERPRRKLTSRVTALVAATVAALSLGVGTAFAVPLIPHWWLWSPEDDITIVSAPFANDGFFGPVGDTIVCTNRIRVLTDGKTADLNTVLRLYQARAFLRSINPDDYEDAARALYANGGDSPMPYEFDHSLMLISAIQNEAQDRGLNGQGVSIEAVGLCLPPQ